MPATRNAKCAFWLEHLHWLAAHHRVVPLHSRILAMPSDPLVRHLFTEHYSGTRVLEFLGEALSCQYMWRTLCCNLSPVEPAMIVRQSVCVLRDDRTLVRLN